MIWQNFMLALSKYFQFSGRSRRSEFWAFALISTLFTFAATFWDNLLFNGNDFFEDMVDFAFLIPSIAVGARRLHDTGRSGWWQLIAFTGIGIIPLIIWFCQDSDFDHNDYGDSPKYGLGEEDNTYPEDQIV